MALKNESEVAEAAEALLGARRSEAERLDPIHAAVAGRANDIYVPQKATEEYRRLVDQSRFNVLPLVITSVAQALFVDGYRPGDGRDDSPVWDAVWQPNRMDARQAAIFRAAVQYGSSYAMVLPGRPVPPITPLSPRRCTALYEDPMVDEWPQIALVWDSRRTRGEKKLRAARLLDDQWVHTVLIGEAGTPPVLESSSEHGLGVTPVVRFIDSFDDLDGGPRGKVEPLLPVQRQLNQTTYSLLMTQHYGAFRQRWVTGLVPEKDANGAPLRPFDVGVDRLLHAESTGTKFGDFQESSLTGYLESRDKALLYIASVAQIPPHNLVVGNAVSNISAEALAALEAGHRMDITEHQTSFGESIEQMLRLAGRAMGDTAAWEDTSGEVVWRDTTPRSLAQVADAWGKVAQMLGAPVTELWGRLPGVTQKDVERWKAALDEGGAMRDLEALLNTPEPGGPGGTGSGGPLGAAADALA